jgi:hypothetical protein
MGYYLPGPAGVTSPGVAPDGLRGQYLRKASDLDFDTEWVDVELSLGGGGGTVTSVNLSAPAGFSVSGGPVTGSGTLALSFAAGFSLPSNTSQANWDTAYAERVRWDGGSTGLVAATGRTSLGLGTAATTDATAYATAAQGGKADTAVQPATLTSGLAGKADLVGGLVPSVQLPGFVDDVLEYANVAAFPATGESGKLYISLATNRQYRWSGSIYVEINPSPGSTDAVPEGSVNLYFTTARGEAAATSWWAASASKTKLDGITAGATANSSDATLLARANHTGTQAASTITGLATSATTDTTDASNISSGTLGAARLATSGVTAGSYGSGSLVPVVTVDAKGRVTAVSTAAVSGANLYLNANFV